MIEGRARLEAMRDRPDFWLDIVGASRAMRDLERARQVIDRLDNLRAWGDQMLTELGRNPVASGLSASPTIWSATESTSTAPTASW
ncbi:MAG: hypothetical protein IPI35_34495 [Deltaproteobacteria bacterium]|nr:hypothetical protein [Deltaproteobacteria bacterium]